MIGCGVAVLSAAVATFIPALRKGEGEPTGEQEPVSDGAPARA